MYFEPWEGLLSNDWFFFFADHYTVLIGLVVSFIMMLLKMWAIVHPSNESNKILCLVSGWLYGFPGARQPVTSPLPEENEQEK